MNVISRASWGARAPKQPTSYTTWSARRIFVVHYSGAASTQTVRSIQNYCMDSKGYSDIDYNLLVDRAGNLYEGRPGIWLAVGAHTLNHNTEGIGICYIGDKTTPLTEPAKTAIRWAYDEANRRRRAAGISGSLIYGPHSRWTSTDCPGPAVNAWLNQGMPGGIPTEGDDMFCAKGDTGDRVKFLQHTLEAAGQDLSQVGGVDGIYGNGTAHALSAVVGGTGDTFGPLEASKLLAVAYRGPQGIQGPPGDPGDTFTITGTARRAPQ